MKNVNIILLQIISDRDVAGITIRIGTQMLVAITATKYVQVFDFFILGHLLRSFVIDDAAVIQLKFDDVAIAILANAYDFLLLSIVHMIASRV